LIARSPSEAVEQYRRSHQLVVSCVTDNVLIAVGGRNANPYQPGAVPHTLLLGEGQFVPISSPDPIMIRTALQYEIAPLVEGRRQREARTRAYVYSIALGFHDETTEFITYHWHPESVQGNRRPHMHVGPAIAGPARQVGDLHVHRAHFPTGIVELSSIIRLLIEEFRVDPNRDDWQEILSSASAN
jgi:hypothetical protein